MELENVDLGAGHEADREGAGAKTVTDKAFVAAEGKWAAEYAGVTYDPVFAEKGKFQIPGKMDLTAVEMTG